MAISTVKATINGTTYDLTLNSTTGKYEASITAPSTTSYTQTGHYYNVSVTATDTANNSTTKDASDATLGASLQLRVKETVKPTISITYPTASAHIASNKPTITWTVTDTGSGINSDTIGITVDSGSKVTSGITKTAITNGYSCSYAIGTALSDGSHTVKFDVTDNDGNAATQVSRTFYVDTVPPTLSVTAPSNNLYTNSTKVTVTGTTNDATSSPCTVTVKLNSGSAAAVTVGSDGSFSKELTLSAGTNTITVVATDGAGKTTTVTRTVYQDSTAPTITAATISPNPANTGASCTITITASDNLGLSSVQANINGTIIVPCELQTSGKYVGSFTAPSTTSYTQTNHYYNVTAIAIDLASNRVTKNANDFDSLKFVVKETVKPSISVTYPTASSTITNNKPTITWTVTDTGSGINSDTIGITVDSGSKVTSGITKTAITNGYSCSYVLSTALTDGSHTLKFDVSDNDGNAATKVSRTFTVDTVPPTLSVTTPTDNLFTNSSTVTVSGVTNDVTSSPCHVNIAIKYGGGVQTVATNVIPDDNGHFTKDITLKGEGLNEISVVAFDAAGKSTTVTRNVTLDTKAPVITAVSITPNPVNTGATYKIEVTVTDQ